MPILLKNFLERYKMKSFLWTSSEAESATNCKSSAAWHAQGVSIDSRSLKEGDIYIALRGANHDGHDFIKDAIAKGASCLLMDTLPKDDISVPFLLVEDTLQALRQLGIYARNRTKAKIIGITGSVGKTSTKEALYIAFSSVARAIANQGGLNNHWGLPLSLARIPEDIDYAILEMGMNHVGEIHDLSLMAKPHLTIITTVAEVHQEFFDSIDEIAKAKCEIFDGIVAPGVIVLNRDCSTFSLQLQKAREIQNAKIVTFGSHVESDVRLMKLTMSHNQCDVQAQIFGKSIAYHLNTNARHLAFNSLSVLSSIASFGLDVEKAASALKSFAPLSGRGKQELIHFKKGSFLLIDESYNASPIAVKAALNVLGSSQIGENGRRIFVFGDMRELGENAQKFHADLAGSVCAENIDLVYACGDLSKALFEAIPAQKRGLHKESSEKLAVHLPRIVQSGDVIMVKGSLSMKMKLIVDSLKGLRG